MRLTLQICKTRDENYMYEQNVKDTSGNYCEYNIKWSSDIRVANSTSSGAQTNRKQTCCYNQWKTMQNQKNGVEKKMHNLNERRHSKP